MKNPRLFSLLAIATAAIPAIASAGGEPPVRVDSTLSFNLRITSEGDETERNNVTSSRFGTTRMGAREALAMLETIAVQQNGFQASEGNDQNSFPAGSRLLVTTGGQVWVVDRDGEGIFNATSYLTFFTERGDGVTAGTFNGNNGDERSTLMFPGRLMFSFSNNQALQLESEEVVSVVGPSADLGEAGGILTEHYSRRFNRFRQTSTESASVAGRVSGVGSGSDGTTVIDGVINLRGREVRDDD